MTGFLNHESGRMSMNLFLLNTVSFLEGGSGTNDLIVVSGADLMSGGNQEKVFVPLSG